ncbi:hypothetical protein E3N88_31970 [Mikania micrantha]|uniref:Pentacotripeptide-repeat region of PRORP domain-containing protein n=1 Tax=Mikania micrantha TaxID=192012 RepID=A0A5N6M8C1_9ASTR|nr:hypothetical protein E3N88_31970 [Mikania micrantha]
MADVVLHRLTQFRPTFVYHTFPPLPTVSAFLILVPNPTSPPATLRRRYVTQLTFIRGSFVVGLCVVAHQVFDKWSSKDKSQVSVFNYERIARLLVDEGLVEVAVLAIEKMTSIHGMKLSSAIYNAIIHGFVENDRFEDALFHLKVMKDLKMKLHSSIYNGQTEVQSNYLCLGKELRKEINGASYIEFSFNRY